MRILHVIQHLNTGGEEIMLLRMIEALAKISNNTLEQRVLTFSAGELDHRLAELGVRLIRVDSGSGLAGRIDRIRGLRREIDGFRPNVVHARLFSAGVYARLAMLGARHRPGFVYHHGGETFRGKRFKRLVTEHALSWLVDAHVCVSESVADHVRSHGLGRCGLHVIPNGIDLERVPPRKRQAFGDVVRLVAVGRLEHIKGQDVLLQAMARLVAAGRKVSIDFMGDGSQRAQLEALTAELRLDAHVNFLGTTNAVDQLQDYDVFVLPSRSEGLPLSLLEAMAAGLPVAATDVGEVASVLGGLGRIATPEHPDSLAEAVEGILADEALALEQAQKARLHARQWDIRTTAQQLLEVYQEASRGETELVQLIASLGGGGAERVAVSLHHEFEQLGHPTRTLTVDDTLAIEKAEEIRPISLTSLKESDSVWKKLALAPLALLELTRTMARLSPRILVSHMERANFLALLVPSRIRKVIVVHNYLGVSLREKHWVKRLFSHVFYNLPARRAHAVVCVSEAAKLDMAKRFSGVGDRLVAIPNSVDVPGIRAKAREPLPGWLQELGDAPVVLNAGRFMEQKGQWHLLRAFSLVHAKHPEAWLVLLGNGPLQGRLEAMARELGIHERVLFPGFEISPFPVIQRADIFALSSIFEGMPMVLLETLACGTPIVSTDCPSGPREIVLPGMDLEAKLTETVVGECGIVTPVAGPNWVDASAPMEPEIQALAGGLNTLLENEQLRTSMGAAALKRAEHFDFSQGALRWQRLLESVQTCGRPACPDEQER